MTDRVRAREPIPRPTAASRARRASTPTDDVHEGLATARSPRGVPKRRPSRLRVSLPSLPESSNYRHSCRPERVSRTGARRYQRRVHALPRTLGSVIRASLLFRFSCFCVCRAGRGKVAKRAVKDVFVCSQTRGEARGVCRRAACRQRGRARTPTRARCHLRYRDRVRSRPCMRWRALARSARRARGKKELRPRKMRACATSPRTRKRPRCASGCSHFAA